jgi:hypothetical protein
MRKNLFYVLCGFSLLVTGCISSAELYSTYIDQKNSIPNDILNPKYVLMVQKWTRSSGNRNDRNNKELEELLSKKYPGKFVLVDNLFDAQYSDRSVYKYHLSYSFQTASVSQVQTRANNSQTVIRKEAVLTLTQVSSTGYSEIGYPQKSVLKHIEMFCDYVKKNR